MSLVDSLFEDRAYLHMHVIVLFYIRLGLVVYPRQSTPIYNHTSVWYDTA